MKEAAYKSVLGNIKYGDEKCAQVQPNSQSLPTSALANGNQTVFRAGRGQRSCPSLRSPGHPLLSCSGEPLTSRSLQLHYLPDYPVLGRKIFVGYITLFVKYISRKSNYSLSSLLSIPLAYLKIF